MGFKEAIRTCLNKYATFSGRAARSEYWYFYLFITLVALVCLGLGFATMNFEAQEPTTLSIIFFGALGIFYLGVLLPLISVLVRRFHDRNMSGWWVLGLIVLGAVPFVGFLASIATLVITVLKGTDGDNRFGPDPLKVQNRAEVFA
jgi:uncharacterized membrane protein YhaH (DUF805 family)